MDKAKQSGFTVYELLITMIIIGVILTIGVPNLAEFTQNSRLTATSNDLHSSFQLARSEAARLQIDHNDLRQHSAKRPGSRLRRYVQ